MFINSVIPSSFLKHGWLTWTVATPTLTHLDWGPLACLLGGFLYSSNPGLLGYSDPKPLESGYYKHVFETEFVEASTSENASGMSHRYPSSHSSHCLGSQKPVLISGGPPGWGGPGSSLLRMTRSVPVGSPSPVGLYPAPSQDVSPALPCRVQDTRASHCLDVGKHLSWGMPQVYTDIL